MVLPAEGNAPLLEEPLLHCVYGMYEEEPLGYVYPFAEPHTPFTGAAPTPTVTDESGEVPPGPVHWKVKVVAEVNGFVRPLPERVPEFDQGPPAEQEVALVLDQVRVERPSYAIGFGEAVRVAVGVAAVHETFVGPAHVPFVQEYCSEPV